MLKVTKLTKFCNDVHIVFSHENINGFENIFMIQCSEGVDLVIKEILFDLVLDFGELNDFNGNLLIIVFIDPFVDFGTETRTNDI